MRLEEWTRGEDTDFLLDEGSEDRAFYPIATYINEYLDEAARKVLTIVPHHRLDKVAKSLPLREVEVDGETITTLPVIENGVGYIPVPSDFIKLFGIRMKCWERAIADTLKVTDDEYKNQQFIHSKGIQSKPKVAVAFGNIEVYSCRDNEPVLFAKYIPIKKAEDLPVEFDELVTLVCASIVEKVFGEVQQSQLFDEQINVMLQMWNV